MPRDPNGRKLGPNDPCWCGSGIKYKRCYYRRESQVHRPFGYYENKRIKNEKSTSYCSCEFDNACCVSKIVRAHSVSRASSLSEIEDNGHVLSLELSVPTSEDDVVRDDVIFRKIGINRASTVRAFCEYHDRKLFRQLDTLDLGDKAVFFGSLFIERSALSRIGKC